LKRSYSSKEHFALNFFAQRALAFEEFQLKVGVLFLFIVSEIAISLVVIRASMFAPILWCRLILTWWLTRGKNLQWMTACNLLRLLLLTTAYLTGTLKSLPDIAKS